ncbi:hypothetical protein [Paraburkholderia lycopersici]|uniref:Phage tail protein n=1 Tax=Paraburkholderia lycopersici TaxID=416944 RepID=A0A1G6IUY3_9BURK|nr:hypothetical protein [Paraburkholderia lycopersici]SDC10317.1 hypothetical protein SAMN05421548_10460 [Paraburkholderia lycopersici]
MNLQDQIGVLEAGVDQLLQAAAAAQTPRADERAAAEPLHASPAAAGEPERAAAPAADAAVTPQAEATEAVATAEAAEAAVEQAETAADAQPELLVARPSQNEITLTIGGRTVTLNALQVGQMIEELSNARASMQPEPPPGIPPGWRFASTKNPVMAVQKQSNGDRLLVLRHTGHGWVPFTFSPDVVVQMYMMLTQR